MLLVNHRKPKIMKEDIFLKHSMGAHQNGNAPIGQGGKLGRAFRPLVAAGQNLKPDPSGGGQGSQAFVMLARQNFGRRHQNALPARLDRDQQRHKGDQGFACPNIALQQTIHPQRQCHIGGYLGNRTGLRAGRLIGQGGQNRSLQRASASTDLPSRSA